MIKSKISPQTPSNDKPCYCKIMQFYLHIFRIYGIFPYEWSHINNACTFTKSKFWHYYTICTLILPIINLIQTLILNFKSGTLINILIILYKSIVPILAILVHIMVSFIITKTVCDQHNYIYRLYNANIICLKSMKHVKYMIAFSILTQIIYIISNLIIHIFYYFKYNIILLDFVIFIDYIVNLFPIIVCTYVCFNLILILEINSCYKNILMNLLTINFNKFNIFLKINLFFNLIHIFFQCNYKRLHKQFHVTYVNRIIFLMELYKLMILNLFNKYISKNCFLYCIILYGTIFVHSILFTYITVIILFKSTVLVYNENVMFLIFNIINSVLYVINLVWILFLGSLLEVEVS